ncbi:MacB family efflux pump subunit [Novosphingobium sp. ST904]|uniref:MacB family efflux pump subunit n=1 Tax=Novosphingobium sp. ST904 TaxID=1684385 RepID=UPI0006C889DA|nr:MacB family efflux pump subunit [Novosphingobium sp. ST904]KPH68112.1 macrolide transporter [Novosphingobium sp. ST904]TCM23709.1 macrolide transport system ATP-binding/permease protein [Novosphingobium sp. ST904]
MTAVPLISLSDVRREYPSGDGFFAALKDINLTIEAGEMVAIVGQSGSGKSTLMNILGCLDRPTSGSYRIDGRDVAGLAPDDLAALRREHFGFIFQRYHLLTDLTALGNVEVPAVYAGRGRSERAGRAQEILGRLGLAERTGHRPGQLSGGQQQRVSIARALMNGGDVIFADEPTGALDSASGVEVMAILSELHAEGHTIVIVTHDMKIAEHADRIIEIRDGEIIDDRRVRETGIRPPVHKFPPIAGGFQQLVDRFREAFRMALLAMTAHKLRTFLTMLGIIIGIASVVSVVALGNGAQQKIIADIGSLGTSTLTIYPGTSFGDTRSAKIQTLRDTDAEALDQLPYADSVTPSVSTSVTARYRNVAATAQVSGVGADYFRVRGLKLVAGSLFGTQSVRQLAQDVVIDENSRNTLFPNGEDPLGKIILLGKVPARVVGVVGSQQQGFGGSDTLTAYVPYTTAMSRMLGQTYLSSITVRISDDTSTSAAEAAVTQLLTRRHGTTDFFISNSDDIRQTITNATNTLTLVVAAIALISLIVGGIGVMNIMLVSVTERTSEIGVRMAVGARQTDIMQQFLIEAILVCLTGGLIGVLLSLSAGVIISLTPINFRMAYSPASMIGAFTCCTLIGLIFGFVPARRAARLDPVDALSRD